MAKKQKEKQYIVEKIMDRRGSANNLEYLIKWKNFAASHNTWEPAENCDCPEAIEEYEKQYSKSTKRRAPSSTRGRSSAEAGPPNKRARATSVRKSAPLPSLNSSRLKLSRPRLERSRTTMPILVSQQSFSRFFDSDDDEVFPNDDSQRASPHNDSPTSDEEIQVLSTSSKKNNAATAVKSEARTPAAADAAVSSEETCDYGHVLRFFKMLQAADDHVKMAEELLKIPDIFYVITSLTVLKRALKEDEKALTNAQQKIEENEGNAAALDQLPDIAAKLEKIKEFYAEIDEKLAELYPPSRQEPIIQPTEPLTLEDVLGHPTESDRREELIVQPTVSIEPEEPTDSPEASKENEIVEEEAKDVPKETEEEENV